MLSFIVSSNFPSVFSFDKETHIETTVHQCGNDPDGNWTCVTMVFEDGSNCTIVDNQGAPGGIAFHDCGGEE